MLPSCSVSFCLSELPHDPLTTRLLWPNTLDISALLCPATTLKSDLFCSDWRQHPPGGIKLLSKIAFVKPQQYYLLKASDKQALIHQGRWVFYLHALNRAWAWIFSKSGVESSRGFPSIFALKPMGGPNWLGAQASILHRKELSWATD